MNDGVRPTPLPTPLPTSRPAPHRPPPARCLALAAAVTIVLGLPSVVHGQGMGVEDRQQIRAIRDVDRTLRLDGYLDDAVWAEAEWVDGFWQREPNEGEPATRRTEVAFVFDDEALWIAGRMFTEDPGAIQAYRTRRDQNTGSERFLVSLDPYLNRRTAVSFGVNAEGSRTDWYHPRDNVSERDFTWDPVWSARVQRDSLGWTAELRMPFSQLRFNGDEPAWGVNINRYMPDRQENLLWELVVRSEPGWSSRLGDLTGLQGVRGRRGPEFLPYVAGGLRTPTGGPQSGLVTHSEARVGADLKLGLGSSLTLDATVNPDFGQVEADPAVVNLTAFEEVFEERRPFFTEGRQLMEGLGPRYFYSRRIGAPPHGRVQADSVEMPDQTTILGAAKVTGRMPGGAAVGALFAVTGREEARTFDFTEGEGPLPGETPATGEAMAPGESRVPVEPLGAFGVARFEQELGESGSTVGLTGTALSREAQPGLSELLVWRAFAGGGDWNLRFGGGEYEFTGHAGFSSISGTSEAILRVQRSSARFFQRPDASTRRLDPSRNSLSGYTAALGMEKTGGRRWLWRVRGEAISPGFEINDIGQMFNADRLTAEADVAIRETLPTAFARSWRLGLTSSNAWNFDGVRTETKLGANATATWHNYLRTTLRGEYDPPALSNHLTRGGPLMETLARWRATLTLANDRSFRTGFNLNGTYGRDEVGGWAYDVRGSLTLRPGAALQVTLEPSYRHEEESRQYLTTLDGGREDTFGRRYLFSAIERSTVAIRFRGAYAFTPDLTLEAYFEPFAASGRRYGIGELLAPRSRELLVYGERGSTIGRAGDGSWAVTEGGASFTLPDADFNILSLRSNVVLRWELQPGSTLFLVWQQDRSDMNTSGELVDPGRLVDSIGAGGQHIFLLKIAYWLPL
ncbi:DUF5916 domain-containing protein [Candidatus Palauibacter sp.]|uniref:DUF5916 domain-containing protein n=1 Tax=Candidatus Palauibacter sp. TaxID=3101350 RepID=UPI003B02A609